MSAIYLVTTPSGKRIIKANSKAAAINFAVRSEVSAEPLTAVALIGHLQDGLVIEDATAAAKAE